MHLDEMPYELKTVHTYCVIRLKFHANCNAVLVA